MDYNFTNFSSKDFEHLVQSLFQKWLGYTSIVFGEGPDGGRELTYEGEVNFPSIDTRWNGYWIVQSKFKSRDFAKKNDFQWVKSNLEEELKKFVNKDRKLRTPNNYLLFTNIVLTPVNGTGGRDKIEIIKEKYKSIVSNIFIGGYDEICRMLDNNRNVILTYSDLLLTSDIISEILEQKDGYKNNKEYKVIENEINILKNENNSNKLKIFELEQEKTILKQRINEARAFAIKSLEKDKKSNLFKKAIWLLTVENDIDGAIELLDEAGLEKQELKSARARILKGKLLFLKLEFSEAERNYQKALQIIDNCETNLELGSFLFGMRKYEKALPFFERAYLLANSHDKLFVANELGCIYSEIGDYASSEKHYIYAIKGIQVNLDNESLAVCFNAALNLANLYSKTNDLVKAESLYDMLIKEDSIINKILPNYNVAFIYGTIGIFYYESERYEDAKAYLESSINLLSQEESDFLTMEYYAYFCAKLGDVFAQLNDFEGSKKHYLNAFDFMAILASSVPEVFLKDYANLIVDMSCLYCYFLDDPIEEISNFVYILKNTNQEFYNYIDCQLGNCIYYISIIYLEHERYEEAKLSFEEAKNILLNSNQKFTNKGTILRLIDEGMAKM